MGRPSKLSDKQWAEVMRLHANGEKAASLAKKYKVSPTQISRRVSQVSQELQNVAALVAQAETTFDALPVSHQSCVRSLADQIKGLAVGVTAVAATSAETGRILALHANQKARDLGPDLNPDDVRLVVGLQEGANRAISSGLDILRANKEVNKDAGKKTLEELVAESRGMG